MHEAALATPLLRLILEETERNEHRQGQKLEVKRVRIRAGLLMGIEPQALRAIFELMAEGTSAQGADLVIEPEPMQGNCPECGKDVSTADKNFYCPSCSGTQVDWKGGNELYIVSIDVIPQTTS